MPDGKRKRRFSDSQIKRRWYAVWRSIRFTRRFGSVAENRRPGGTVMFLRGQLAAAMTDSAR